jgi:hypothetical protein
MPLIPVRNKLIYPAGATPGFDPTHPAAQGIVSGHGFAGVASNNGFANLVNGARGTLNTSPTSGIIGAIGPGLLCDSGNKSATFAGNLAANDTAFTVAGIVQHTSIGGNFYLLSNTGTTGKGFYFGHSSSSQISFTFNGGGSTLGTPGLAYAANTPYFIAASAIQSGANYIFHSAIKNLLTGAITTTATTQVSTGPAAASDGTYMVGNTPSGFQSLHGYIAAAMFAPSFLTRQQLLRWAEDPWSFWYPTSKRVYLVSSGAPADVTGTFAAVETADGAAFVGDAGLVGTLAATETADAAAFNAAIVATGTLAATEAKDTAAFNAAIIATGTLAASETADTAAFVGGIIGAGINANLAAVETADNAAFAGAVTGVAGTLAATEAKDTAVFTGAIFDVITGTLAATEAKDTAAFAGVGAVIGILAATETADTAHFSSAKVNQIKGLVAQQSPVPGLVAQQSDDGKAPGFIAQYRP